MHNETRILDPKMLFLFKKFYEFQNPNPKRDDHLQTNLLHQCHLQNNISDVSRSTCTCYVLLISRNQSAFIDDRHISVSIALAEEQIRGFSQQSTSQWVCIIVDLQKAFNTFQWKVVNGTMRGMGFSHPFISLILDCISTTHFSILVKGQPSVEFQVAEVSDKEILCHRCYLISQWKFSHKN